MKTSTVYKPSTISNIKSYSETTDIQLSINQWSTSNILVIAWLIGLISILVVYIIRNAYFYRNTMKNMKLNILSDNIYEEAAKIVGLKKRVPVYISQSLESPCIIGAMNPVIILTENIMQDTRATRLALIHEMVHYKQ